MRHVFVLLSSMLGLAGAAAAEPPERAAVLKKTRAINKMVLDRRIAERAGLLGAQSDVLGVLGGGAPSPAADAAFDAQRYAAARPLYEEAVAAEPACEDRRCPRRASRRLARTCEELDDLACAERAWRRVQEAERLSPLMILAGSGGDSPLIRRNKRLSRILKARRQGRAALEAGRFEEAVAAYARADADDTRCPGERCSPVFMRNYATALAAAGKRSEAAGWLTGYLQSARRAPDRRRVTTRLEALRSQIAAAERAAAAEREARVVRLSGGEAAPWLRSGPLPDMPRFSSITHGTDAAVAREAGSKRWFGYRRGGRVFGPLKMPARIAWVGLGGDDALYVATEEGRLHRADTPEAATKARVRPLARLKGALGWDVAGATVVARGADGHTVHASTDRGRSFRAHRFEAKVHSAHARFDDLVVVGAADGAHVSRDGGRTWAHTPLGSLRLQRRGGLIGRKAWRDQGGRSGGATPAREACALGVLSADGQTWVVPTWEDLPRVADWSLPFTAAVVPTGPTRLRSQSLPAPPTRGEPAAPEVAKCLSDPGAYFDGRGGAGMADGGPRCKGLECLGPPTQDQGAIRYASLGDGRCGVAATDRTPLEPVRSRHRWRSWASRSRPVGCEARALSAPATLIIGDGKEVRLLSAPDCLMTRIWSVGGLGVVACAEVEGRTALRVLDAAGATRETTTITGRVQHLSMAADGTLLVQVERDDRAVAHVRRPITLGAAGAWFDAELPGAFGWRPAPGGVALALARASQPRSTGAVQPGRLRPSEGVRRAYTAWGLYKKPLAACYAEALAAAPDLAGALTYTLTFGPTGETHIAGLDREEMSGDAAGLLGCLRPVIEGLRFTVRPPEAMAGARLEQTLRFDAHPRRFSVWAVDTTARRLADGVDLGERDLTDLEIDDRGQLVIEARRGAPCLLPRSGSLLCPEVH